MRETVAVVTDVHANPQALEATLERIAELGIRTVYCGGDLVGYGPHPTEVCAMVAAGDIPTIYGNYDYAIGRDLHDCGCAYRDPHDKEIGQLSVEWTLTHTSRRAKAFMREFPFDLRFELANKRIRLVHGSPRKVNEYLFEDKPARTFERIAAMADCEVLVFGHTHKPWVHRYGDVLFVNCGSVGKPKDGDARAAFAVLRVVDGEIDVTIERVAYDALSVAGRCETLDCPTNWVSSWFRQPERRGMRYVLFVCTHNAGRSQMAQAFFEKYAPDDIRAESAGQEPAEAPWPEVVEALLEVGIDISGRKPKKIDLEMQLHADFAVTLNCADTCPYVPATVEDWEIDDPRGRPIEEVRRIRDEIEARVREFVDTRLDEVRADKRAHELRLVRVLPSLVEEFDGVRTPEEIRACTDAILERYDDVPVRSFVLTLARRTAAECLRADVCDALADREMAGAAT